MARKKGQIIRRGTNTWLVRVYLGRDPQSGTRKYHNQTVQGPLARSTAAFESQAAATRQRPCVPRRGNEP